MFQALGLVFITLFMMYDLSPRLPNKVALVIGAITGIIGVFLGDRVYYIIYGSDIDESC